MRLVRVDPEMVQLHLRLRPRQRDRAIEGRRVAILVGERQRRLARGGDERRERRGGRCRRAGGARGVAGSRSDRARSPWCSTAAGRRSPTSACGCRVRARGIARGPSRTERRRRARPRPRRRGPPRPTAPRATRTRRVAEERLELGARTPSGRRASRTPGARRRRPAAPGRARRRRSARARASATSEVRDRDAAHLGVVLRRDQHLERGRDGAVAPNELGAVLGERRRRTRPARRPSADTRPTTPRRSATSRTKTYVPQWSRVTSSRHRVTARPPQRL